MQQWLNIIQRFCHINSYQTMNVLRCRDRGLFKKYVRSERGRGNIKSVRKLTRGGGLFNVRTYAHVILKH